MVNLSASHSLFIFRNYDKDPIISATLADLDSIPNFTLNDNESKIIDFFTFHVVGSGLGVFDLTANLNFDAPALDVGSDGSGGWGTVTIPWPSRMGGGTYSGGIFSWDNPVQTFSLTDGNTVQISLEDGFALGQDSDAIVHATITNQGGGVAPVPEPATMLLFGTSLLGLVGYSRKRAQKS